MALILGEQPIVEAISEAFTYFKANLAVQVPDIFAYATPQDQTEITTLWSSAKYNPIIIGGYPQTPLNAPTVAVTLDSEKESTQYTGLSQTGIQLSGSPAHAGEFETTYGCHCFSAGYKNLLWLQVLTKWALLVQRIPMMQSITSSGLPTGYFNKQTVSASGLMRAPNDLGDGIPIFQRTVNLTASHVDTWTDIKSYPIMISGGVTLTDSNPTTISYSV